jgi:hypothetical protein
MPAVKSQLLPVTISYYQILSVTTSYYQLLLPVSGPQRETRGHAGPLCFLLSVTISYYRLQSVTTSYLPDVDADEER